MRNEIEALLRSYFEDKDREAQFVTDLLCSLAVGASSRSRMIDEIATAVEKMKSEPTKQGIATQAFHTDDLEKAVVHLREVGNNGRAY